MLAIYMFDNAREHLYISVIYFGISNKI